MGPGWSWPRAWHGPELLPNSSDTTLFGGLIAHRRYREIDAFDGRVAIRPRRPRGRLTSPNLSATTCACAVWSQIGAEDAADAFPFNLDDCQHFVDFISLMTDQRPTRRSGSSSE